MTQPRYPKEQTRWRDYIERLLQQHHVDIQRLWRRIPQTPFAAGGVPLTGDTSVDVDQGSGTIVGTVISGPPNNFGSANSFGPYSGSPFSGTPQTGGTVNTGGTASGTPNTGGTASGTVETGGTATGTPAGGSTGGTNTGGTPNTGGTASGTIETGGSASGGTAATGTANESLVRSHPRTDNYTGEWYRSGPFSTHAQHLRNGAEPDDSATYIYTDAFGTPQGDEFYRASLDGLEGVPDNVPLRLVIRSRSDLIDDVPIGGGGVTGTNTGHATGFTGADDATMAARSKLTLTLINTTAEGSGTMLTGVESSIVHLDVPQKATWQTHYYYLTQHDRARIVNYGKLGIVLDASFIPPGGGVPVGARVLVSWVELQAMYTTGHTGGTATGTPNTGGTASGTIETGGTPQTGGTTTAGTTNTGGTNTGGTPPNTGGTPDTGSDTPGFPVVRSTSSGNSGGLATSTVITMPSGFKTGDMLIVFIATDGVGGVFIGSGTGWTVTGTATSAGNRLTVYTKRANGTGDNLTLTHSNVGTAYTAYAIHGAHASTAPEDTTASAGATANPDPGSLNPAGWGTENTLWIVADGWDDGTTDVSAYPSNYTMAQVSNRWNNSSGVGVASACRMLNAASEDPGTFTLSASENSVTSIVAVRPN